LNPADTLTIDPFAVSLLLSKAPLLRVNKYADSVLLIVAPASNIHGSVSPCESAFAVFLSILEVSFISAPVIPSLNPAALNCAHSKFALIVLVYISEIVLAAALELSIHELSFKVAAVGPLESPLSLLLSFVELPDVACAAAVVPDLLALAMLRIVDPLAGVPDALCRIIEGAPPSGLVKLPLAHVDVTIRLSHLASAVKQSIVEEAFVARTIGVNLDTEAVFFVGDN